jgi:hypothetical protein
MLALYLTVLLPCILAQETAGLSFLPPPLCDVTDYPYAGVDVSIALALVEGTQVVGGDMAIVPALAASGVITILDGCTIKVSVFNFVPFYEDSVYAWYGGFKDSDVQPTVLSAGGPVMPNNDGELTVSFADSVTFLTFDQIVLYDTTFMVPVGIANLPKPPTVEPPVEPPTGPVDPPVEPPVDPPTGPVDPPAGPVDPPTGPTHPPTYPPKYTKPSTGIKDNNTDKDCPEDDYSTSKPDTEVASKPEDTDYPADNGTKGGDDSEDYSEGDSSDPEALASAGVSLAAMSATLLLCLLL